MPTRPRLILAVLLVLLGSYYGLRIDARSKATPIGTTVAPNGAYRIDFYAIRAGDPMILLFRVFDRDQRLVGEYVRDYPPGRFRRNWECDARDCSEFWWDTGDDDRIALPPSRLDRLRARLP